MSAETAFNTVVRHYLIIYAHNTCVAQMLDNYNSQNDASVFASDVKHAMGCLPQWLSLQLKFRWGKG